MQPRLIPHALFFMRQVEVAVRVEVWRWRAPENNQATITKPTKDEKGLLILSARLIENWQVSGHYYYLGTWISLRERWLASNKCKQPNIVSCYVTQSISIPLSITHNPSSIIHRPPPTSTSHYPSIFGCIRKKQKKREEKMERRTGMGQATREPHFRFLFSLYLILTNHKSYYIQTHIELSSCSGQTDRWKVHRRLSSSPPSNPIHPSLILGTRAEHPVVQGKRRNSQACLHHSASGPTLRSPAPGLAAPSPRPNSGLCTRRK